MITINVVYALPNKQTQCSVIVPENTPVAEAIALSKICDQHPEIDLQQHAVGIFSKKVTLSALVKEGDRIEIYRPLTQDPKVLRKNKL